MDAPASLHKKSPEPMNWNLKESNRMHISVLFLILWSSVSMPFFFSKKREDFIFIQGYCMDKIRHRFLKQAIFECSFKESHMCVCVYVSVYMHIYIPNPPAHLFSDIWMFWNNHSFSVSARRGRLLRPAGAPGSLLLLSLRPALALHAGSLLRSTLALPHLPPLPLNPPLPHDEGSLTPLRPPVSVVCAWQPLLSGAGRLRAKLHGTPQEGREGENPPCWGQNCS